MTLQEEMSTSGRLATFFVGDLFFGIDVLRVQEVLLYQQMTRVPGAPDVIAGLINLRGQIVTAIDMRRRLGMPSRADGAKPLSMVIRTLDGAVSLLVDEVGDVLDVDERSFEKPPENLVAEARELIRCVCKLDERLMLVLDTEKTVETAIATAGMKSESWRSLDSREFALDGNMGKERFNREEGCNAKGI